VPDRAKAEAVRAGVDHGLSFEKAAAKSSAPPPTAPQWYKKGQLQTPLEAAASELKPGACSVIETESGFFVIFLVRRAN
jgi:parvulin-like peptidyl-prolyl isomerase